MSAGRHFFVPTSGRIRAPSRATPVQYGTQAGREKSETFLEWSLTLNTGMPCTNRAGWTTRSSPTARRCVPKPDHSEAHNNLGAALQARGRMEEAIAAYREAVRRQPNYATAWSNLGSALQGQGNLDEAVAAYREALRLNPDYAMAHYNLGNALRVLRRPVEAIDACRAAARLKPDFPEAHSNLGAVLNEQGHLEEARAAYQDALRLRPDWGSAAATLVHLDRQLCRWDGLAPRAAALREAIVIDAPLAKGINPFSMLVSDAIRAPSNCAAPANGLRTNDSFRAGDLPRPLRAGERAAPPAHRLSVCGLSRTCHGVSDRGPSRIARPAGVRDHRVFVRPARRQSDAPAAAIGLCSFRGDWGAVRSGGRRRHPRRWGRHSRRPEGLHPACENRPSSPIDRRRSRPSSSAIPARWAPVWWTT